MTVTGKMMNREMLLKNEQEFRGEKELFQKIAGFKIPGDSFSLFDS